MQSLTDQAWEKVRGSGTVQQGLEAEVVALRQQVGQSDSERGVLLTAVSLLAGALYPLYARAAALSAQRHLLQDQNAKLEAFRQQVQRLVGAISGDGAQEEAPRPSRKKGRRGREEEEDRPRRGPLLRFRTAVISVIAANRLVHFSKGNCRLFTARDAMPGMHIMTVCAGGIQPREKPFKGTQG